MRWQGTFTIVGACPNDPAPAPGAYYFALLVAPAGTSDPAAFVFVGLYATNVSGARVSSGTLAVPGWAAGQSRSFMVYGWSAAAGPQWNQNWILNPPPVAFGHSAIETGIAGGTDGSGTPWPTLIIDISGLYLWPYIYISPAEQTVPSGSSVSFQTVGTPACGNFSHQWFFGSNSVPNETNVALFLDNVQPSASGTYRVRLSSFVYGEKYSEWASLTVTPTRPSIVSSPTNQVVADGRPAVFSVIATGTLPFSYQWYQNGQSISGATQAELHLRHVAPWLNGAQYYVDVSNWLGSARSDVGTLTVFATTPFVEQHPLAQTAESGAQVELQVQAWGSALHYQWWLGGNELPGKTLTLLTIDGIQPSQAGGYSVVVTNFVGAVTSSIAQVSVIAPVPRRPVAGLSVNAPPGMLYLQYTTSPNEQMAWQLLDVINVAGSPQWYFDLSPILASRYYRALSAATPSTLDLHIVPAITVSGPVGGTVRLDCINQFGPVDAWRPLAAITLTNATQLYFDASIIGQSWRLYRLVPISPGKKDAYENSFGAKAQSRRRD